MARFPSPFPQQPGWFCDIFTNRINTANDSIARHNPITLLVLDGAHNGLAAIGVTRSYGTPEQEYLISLLPQTSYLGEAVLQYMNRVTAEEYISYGNPDEANTFVYDITFMGDPFLAFVE